MSDFPDPYAPGAAPVMAPPPPPLSRPPGQIKVLAILHLVFGGIGLLMVAFGIVMQLLSSSLLKSSGAAQDPAIEMQRAMGQVGQVHQYLSYGVSVVLSILLIIAGLTLLKSKLSGLKWSNVYAWLSIGSKIALGVLFFTMVLPAVNAAMEGVLGGAKADETAVSVAKMTMVASGVLTPLFSCIYPVLVLILLNREPVRRSLH